MHISGVERARAQWCAPSQHLHQIFGMIAPRVLRKFCRHSVHWCARIPIQPTVLMPAPASSPQRRDLPSTSARGVRGAIAVLFALVIAAAITVATDKIDSEAAAAVVAGAVVLPLAQAAVRVTPPTAVSQPRPPAPRIAEHKRPPF